MNRLYSASLITTGTLASVALVTEVGGHASLVFGAAFLVLGAVAVTAIIRQSSRDSA